MSSKADPRPERGDAGADEVQNALHEGTELYGGRA
jgi:hypothetical protein